MKRVLCHFALWLAVFGGWVAVSRDHHPTLLLNALASAVLVAASAVAVYANALVLRPRYIQKRRGWRYALELALTVMVLDLVSVLAIQWLYDMLWGPDPLRYGFWMNIGLEAGFIGLHVAVAVAIVTAFRIRMSAKRNNRTGID